MIRCPYKEPQNEERNYCEKIREKTKKVSRCCVGPWHCVLQPCKKRRVGGYVVEVNCIRVCDIEE